MKIPNRTAVAHLPQFPVAAFKDRSASEVSRLRRRYEYAQIRLALHKRAYEPLEALIAIPLALGMFVSLFALPVIVHSLTAYGALSFMNWVVAYIVYAGAGFVAGACIIPDAWYQKLNRRLIKDQRWGFKTRVRILWAWVVISVTLFAWVGMRLLSADNGLTPQLKIGLAAGLSFPAVLLGLGMFSAVLISPLRWLASYGARAKYPDARIAIACARVLTNDTKMQQGQSKLYRQREQVVAYEELARLIERDLRKVLRTTVPSANAWTSAVTREMAAAQREAQRNVFFGDPHLGAEGARNTLIAALTSNWTLAPRAEYKRTDQQRRFVARLGAALRLAFIGLAPLGTLLALRYYDVVRDIPESLMLLAFGWMVTTLLGIIDPGLGSRMSLFKDALSTLGGPGK